MKFAFWTLNILVTTLAEHSKNSKLCRVVWSSLHCRHVNIIRFTVTQEGFMQHAKNHSIPTQLVQLSRCEAEVCGSCSRCIFCGYSIL